jgi:hypothetical protein
MSDQDIEPDAVVRTALQLLPIPAHGDDFWQRLEASLDAEVPVPLPVEARSGDRVDQRSTIGAPAVASPTPIELDRDTSLAVVPPAFRRRSNILLVAAAAAAVVVVGIAGRALLEEREGGTVSGDRAGAGAEALETLVRDAQGGRATVTTLSSDRESSSTEAVLAWVADLGDGDTDGAWSAMGDASQAHFTSRSEFQAMMPDLAEGYGAWSAAEPDDVLVTPVSSDDEGTIAVVTLMGMVDQEGTSQERVDAFPVRLVDGDVIVEPFASAGPLEVVVPEPVTAEGAGFEDVGLDEELVFVVPASAEAPVLRLDGGDTVICGEADGTELHDLEDADGQRCAYLPEGGFDAGRHVVTVAFVDDDGTAVTASSLRFAAA